MEEDLDFSAEATAYHHAIRADTTRWSMILAAAESDPQAAQVAMTQLAEQYLLALYAYVRHRTGNVQDTADVVHDFYTERLPGLLNAAREEKGSFRGLLKQGVDWWLIECHRKETAQKRDVRRNMAMPEDGERFYADLTAQNLPAEMVWDLSWASVLCARAMDEMAREAPERERRVLQVIRQSAERGEDLTRDELAKQAGISPNAVSQVQRKLRERLRRKGLEYCRDVKDFEAESAYFLKLLGVKGGR